jgi:hypothetical protein
MKRVFSWPGVLLLLVIVTTSCTKENSCIRGNNDIVTETINLPVFEGIDFRLPGNVRVVKGTQPSIVIKASDNHIDIIRAEVRSGDLVIDTDNRCLRNTKIDITITTPTFNYLRVAGSGDMVTEAFTVTDAELKVDGSGSISATLSGNEIEATISGSGDIQLAGTAENFKPVISGSGDIKAYNLPSKNVQARISGSGKIQTRLSGRLDATIAGSGDVYYKGNPTAINTSISGSGKVVKED